MASWLGRRVGELLGDARGGAGLLPPRPLYLRRPDAIPLGDVLTAPAAPVLRPMRWWDIEQVSEIEREVFPVDAWSPEQFWSELAQDTRSYVVAELDGRVVGYAGAFVVPPDSDLQTVAVLLHYQGRGLAAGMLTMVTDVARAAGCSHMILEVRADNSRAIALYERFGFERISQRPRYYPDGVDALIMRHRL